MTLLEAFKELEISSSEIPNLSLKDIEKIYKKLVRKYHPDGRITEYFTLTIDD